MSTFVGIDVAKRDCVVWLEQGQQGFTVSNDAAGMKQLKRRLAPLEQPHVILEATGGYELLAVRTLVSKAVTATVLNPRMARDFAKATGATAKTDAIDARQLAHYGRALRPKPNTEAYVANEPFRALAARRRQVVEQLVEEKNHLEHGEAASLRSTKRHISWLKKEILRMDKELEREVQKSPELIERRARLMTVPGIARISATQLLAYLPQLGRATKREIAALAGLAPRNRDSGKMRGKRTTGGGRRHARAALYMPTLTAIKHNPLIRQYYRKLVESGKPKMVAITAAMRKLLTIINAMLQKNEDWKTA